MRRLSSAILALCFASSALAAQANLPDTAYTTAAVSLRAKPDPNARSVGRLAAETPVHVVACENAWCQTAVNGLNGYLPRLSLSAEPNGAFKEGSGYTNSKGNRVRSPTRTPDNQRPTGASAQCRDGTHSFSQSRRGTCSHHGGVARWLN
jgi:Protein of unknown function (DUF3761)/Bacterial SH3 domain